MVAKLYSPELAAEICRRLADGDSLVKICGEAGMPSRVTVYDWIDEYPEFGEAYNKARKRQAESYVDEAMQIADGVAGSDSGPAVGAARLQSDIRVKLAGKFNPERFGDKLDIHQQINVNSQHLHAVLDLARDEEPPRTLMPASNAYTLRIGPTRALDAIDQAQDTADALANPFDD